MQAGGVTEDTPLWDEEDALDTASGKSAAKKPGAAAKKPPGAAGAAAGKKGTAAAEKAEPKTAAATGAVIPSAKKAKEKAAAAKNSDDAAKVGVLLAYASFDFLRGLSCFGVRLVTCQLVFVPLCNLFLCAVHFCFSFESHDLQSTQFLPLEMARRLPC